MLTMQSHERFPVALNSRFLDRNEVELFQYVFSREGGECFIWDTKLAFIYFNTVYLCKKRDAWRRDLWLQCKSKTEFQTRKPPAPSLISGTWAKGKFQDLFLKWFKNQFWAIFWSCDQNYTNSNINGVVQRIICSLQKQCRELSKKELLIEVLADNHFVYVVYAWMSATKALSVQNHLQGLCICKQRQIKVIY